MTDRTTALIFIAAVAVFITATAYTVIYSIPRVVMTLSDVQQ